MKGLTKAARTANGRSRKCAICPIRKNCNLSVHRACSDAFVEGFKKGARWEKERRVNDENHFR